jgi:hypothetical protein
VYSHIAQGRNVSRNVRIVPDVAVSGTNANPALVDRLLGLMVRSQSKGHERAKPA